MAEYYDLYSTHKLDGAPTTSVTSRPLEISKKDKESFVESLNFNHDAPANMDMDTNISNKHLITNTNALKKNPSMDYSDKVSNPYGYGYTPTLNETRNSDSLEIFSQESTMFALGAVAGVSLIVLGLIISSTSPQQ